MKRVLPYFAVIVHTVSSGDQPRWTDNGRSAHVAVGFNLEADLPRKLSFLCVLTAHDTRRLEPIPAAVCKAAG